MTYDESNAKLTELCTGRTVNVLIRKDPELILAFTDGLEVTIAADVNGNIQYKKHTKVIQLSGLNIHGIGG